MITLNAVSPQARNLWLWWPVSLTDVGVAPVGKAAGKTGTAWSVQPSPMGPAFTNDGTSGNYLGIVDVGGVGLTHGQALTLSCWAKPTQTTTETNFFSISTAGASEILGLTCIYDNFC